LIFAIMRTALIALRRDRGALALSFILPIGFFHHLCRDLRRAP